MPGTETTPDLESTIARAMGLIQARKAARTAQGSGGVPASPSDLLAGEAAGAGIPPTRVPVTGGPEGTLRQGYVRSILRSRNPAAKAALEQTGGPEFPPDVGGGSVAVPAPVSRSILGKRTPAASAKIGAVSPQSFTPESIATFESTGNYDDLVPIPKTATPKDPETRYRGIVSDAVRQAGVETRTRFGNQSISIGADGTIVLGAEASAAAQQYFVERMNQLATERLKLAPDLYAVYGNLHLPPAPPPPAPTGDMLQDRLLTPGAGTPNPASAPASPAPAAQPGLSAEAQQAISRIQQSALPPEEKQRRIDEVTRRDRSPRGPVR